MLVIEVSSVIENENCFTTLLFIGITPVAII